MKNMTFSVSLENEVEEIQKRGQEDDRQQKSWENRGRFRLQ